MSAPETVTAEEYKEQFGRHGFLAPVMELIAHNNRGTHADWFELARDTNTCLQAIAVKAMEEQAGVIGDKNVLSTLLLLRSRVYRRQMKGPRGWRVPVSRSARQ
jgi:hypothetical protein